MMGIRTFHSKFSRVKLRRDHSSLHVEVVARIEPDFEAHSLFGLKETRKVVLRHAQGLAIVIYQNHLIVSGMTD